ncbi:MAG: hypothetical protein ABIU30_18845 [Ferruginibacter sp.]
MAPKETSVIKRPRTDFFSAITRLPPQEVQRIPTMVRLMIILSRSRSGISVHKNENTASAFKKKGMNVEG